MSKLEEKKQELRIFVSILREQKPKSDLESDALKLAADLLLAIESLENIRSTKKSDLMENPAYWGQMIVGEAASTLEQLTNGDGE